MSPTTWSSGEDTRECRRAILRVMTTEHFPKLNLKNKSEIWRTQQIPSRLNKKKPTSRHILVKPHGTKNKGLKNSQRFRLLK